VIDKTKPFPSAVQALLLVVALFAIEFLIDIGLDDLREVLGLTSTQAGVLGRLVANGCVFATVMQWQGLTYRGLFHPAGTSMRDTALALVPWVVMLVPALVLLLSVVMGIETQAFPLSDSERAMFERMAQNDLAMTLLACVIAPTVEEMLFRGVILRGFLQRYSRSHAIWGSAALFGLAHQNIYQFVVALLIGALSGWLYDRARSLVPCIALHATYNTSLWLLGHSQAGAGAGSDSPDPDMGAWWLASLALAAVGLYQLLRAFRARDAGPDA